MWRQSVAHNPLLLDPFYVTVRRNCKMTLRDKYSVSEDVSELLKEFAPVEKDDSIIFLDTTELLTHRLMLMNICD